MHALVSPACALLLAPLFVGIINRTKAIVAGRRGAPLLQSYWDIAKCLRRGVVFGEGTTWLFRLGPLVNLASLIAATVVVPLGGIGASLSFSGDLIVLAGLFALGRFATMLAALDTGSSFEGMGASREAHFAALAEPALFLVLAALARITGSFSLTPIYEAITVHAWINALPALVLVAASLLILELTENTRIPVDDPTTHLELTMIHEVMVLDHSGPELAAINYAAALRLWLIGSLFVGLAVPVPGGTSSLDAMLILAGMVAFAVVIGAIESTMARYRLVQVPQFIVTAATLATVAFIIKLV